MRVIGFEGQASCAAALVIERAAATMTAELKAVSFFNSVPPFELTRLPQAGLSNDKRH
jgi:hypothetical protein